MVPFYQQRKKTCLAGLNLFICVFVIIGFCAVPGALAAGKLIGIAGGPSGGAYYPLSIGISEIITKHIPDTKVDVAVTGGAVKNCTLVGTHEMDMGFTNGDAAYEAFTATGRYAKNKLSDIRVLFGGVAGGALHIIVAKNKGINSLSDLKGKRVAIGPQGGTTEFLAPAVLKYFGVNKGDMKLTYISYADGTQALADGQVDAAMLASPIPSAAVKELATVGKIDFKILDVATEKVDQFLKDNPYFVKLTIPAKMYGLGADVQTVASTNIFSVNAKVDADLVYQITKSIFENMDIFYKSHPSAKNVKIENAPVRYVPLHPGAERYYREKGLIN